MTRPDFSLTKRAIEKLQSSGLEMRIGIRGAGCSGYTLAIEEYIKPLQGDTTLAYENVTIYVDHKSFEFLRGMTLDYEKKRFPIAGQTEYTLIDPNNRISTCGCGQSITLK